ncbi:SAM-dependent methyltransferase [Nocardia goodfellowii]|uniref:SAM-dependent methyltransferase n=1 Tax=Nocardia goodfellowii TaxID=882446 RepID=A0ABS4QA78_9NOCA|nr:class I SAM-dependent methyltransferase [Nocardia goodfellowii]MBP2188602.1 SAM-dependent methyltransferase [Nocardia goodfellowii]
MADTSASQSAQDFWEAFYQERDQIWTGNPNPLLVREAIDLTPGTALDLGSGEGGDAIWLAQRGWTVTAADISATALGRAAGHAEAAGVGDRITWVKHDLAQSFPEGTFDLVSAQFLHSPVEVEGERNQILRRAAAAVAPGGALLIGSHAGWASNQHEHHHDVHFPTLEEMLDAIAGVPGEWQVQTKDEVEREWTAPDGTTGVRTDSVLRVHRSK